MIKIIKDKISLTKKRGSIAKELFEFLWETRLWWLMPMVIVFLLFGLLLIFAETSPAAPFIYTLF